MNQAESIVPALRKLSALHVELKGLSLESAEYSRVTRRIKATRATLPTAILGHVDRMHARGKAAVAAVARGVCGGCHLVIPRGRVLDLQRHVDALNVCDNCGVFIYLGDKERLVNADRKVISQPVHNNDRKTSTRRSRSH